MTTVVPPSEYNISYRENEGENFLHDHSIFDMHIIEPNIVTLNGTSKIKTK